MNLISGLDERQEKPRNKGLSFVIDPGLGNIAFKDMIDIGSNYIDLVKFGWGTSLVSNNLKNKIKLLNENNIPFFIGGTVFELSYKNNRIKEFEDWLNLIGAPIVEISDGIIDIKKDEKNAIIKRLSSNFVVFAEVGSKDSSVIMSPARWIDEIKSAFKAGASMVICEGRENGSAGIYRSNGEIRMGLIQEIQDVGIDINKIIWEAPQSSQQTWMIKNLGINVNLGNISPNDIINLETLRLGLRTDTVIDD